MPPKTVYKKSYKPKTPGSAAGFQKFVKSGVWLVIVESPSKCKKIEEYLGGQYQCIASKGHIRTIDGLKSIDVKNQFQPTFTIIDEKREHVNTMSAIIRQFPPENVLLATDDDREGEAIAWHICQVFGLPIETTKRILFHEITRDAIVAAVAAPTRVNMPLVYAQHARQILDIVVGYTVSPVLWKQIYNNKTNGLSAGRCQTPALRIIYENHLEYMSRTLNTEYHTTGYFFDKVVKFQLDRKYTTSKEIEAFLEKSKTFPHRLSISPDNPMTKSPPTPFTTSRLLQVASSTLHYSPKQTMDLCQKLYQGGLITYMRTDSAKYSPVFLKQAEAFIEKTYGSTSPGSGTKWWGDVSVIENRDVSNPHEAIRVSNINLSEISDTDRVLVSMYRLIWKNTVESCMSAATYRVHTATITSPDEDGAKYTHTLEIPVFLGWKRVSGITTECAEEQTGMLMYFQSMAEKPIPLQYIESRVHAESRHSHYTEASLIQRLETLGIGRPSTYASIVETIQERGYVKQKDVAGLPILCQEYKLTRRTGEIETTETERIFGAEKRKLTIQPTGIIAVEFLVKYFDSMFSYDYTKNMESRLDSVSADVGGAQTSWVEICRECHALIKTLKSPLSKMKRETYPLEDGVSEVVFHSSGASIKFILGDGSAEYRSVRKNMEIDLGKLKRREYSVADLLEIPEECLGEFENRPVLLKSGPYGLYVELGKDANAVPKKVSLKSISKPADQITLEDVIPLLSAPNPVESATKESEEGAGIPNPDRLDLSAISDTYSGANYTTTATTTNRPGASLRTLTPELSVRTGKFGAYVFYQKPGVKKPTFLNIKKFKENCWTCNADRLLDWLRETYQI